MRKPEMRDRRQLIWPIAGMAFAIVIIFVVDPSLERSVSLKVGIAAWCAAMVLVLTLSAHPTGARVGAFMGGLFAGLPCFVLASPLVRCLLMCFMQMPFLAGAALVMVPPISGMRNRLAYLCSWCGTHEVKRRKRSFDAAAATNLIVATAILAAGLAVTKAASSSGGALPVRWLAGGITIFAFAEMVTVGLALVTAAFGITVPAFMNSPYRSASIGEFWAKRWNLGVSLLFRKCCFDPLARRSVLLGLLAVFVVSAVGHALLAHMALGKWTTSLICGGFFLVQPLLIGAERRMNVRRWRPVAARMWTLGLLALTSPLIVEPSLQIIERRWGGADDVLTPTLATLGAVVIVSSIVALAAVTSHPSVPRPYGAPHAVRLKI